MKPPRYSVKPGKPSPTASSASDCSAATPAAGFRTASTVASGGAMDVMTPTCEESRPSGEKLVNSLVRGLPLLLQPHQVDVIWRAAAAEELLKAAAAKALNTRQERQPVRPPLNASATEANMPLSYLPPNGDGQNSAGVADLVVGRGPSDIHQAAAGQNQRSVPAAGSAGKKGTGSAGRDSVARAGKEGPSILSFAKGSGAGAGGSGNTPPGCAGGSSKLRPESATSGYGAEGDSGLIGYRPESEAVNFRETACVILRLGSQGRRNPVVVDFHLFNLLFARQLKLNAAKTALFVSIMGAALAQLEKDARVACDISPASQLLVLQSLFQLQTYDSCGATQQPGAAAASPSSVPGHHSPAAFPYFSPKEARTLMKFAIQTFVSHCRLYLYCLKHPQSEVATTHHVLTFLPVIQPECPLTPSEIAPKTGAASQLSPVMLTHGGTEEHGGASTEHNESKGKATVPVAL